jgi:hypothetical protein
MIFLEHDTDAVPSQPPPGSLGDVTLADYQMPKNPKRIGLRV